MSTHNRRTFWSERRFITVAPLLLVLAAPLVVTAQPSPARLECWAAIAAMSAPSAGELRSEYRPETIGFPATFGRAREAATLESGASRAFEAGLQVFFSRHVGVRAAIATSRADLGGTLGPYSAELVYSAMLPPDYVSREYRYADTMDGQDAVEGRLRHLTISLGPVVRTRGARVQAAATLGPALVRTSGEAGRLTFTHFRLGGHSVLFPEHVPVDVAFEPATRLGLMAGGDVDVVLSPRVALMAGLRMVGVREAEATVRVAHVGPSTLVGELEPAHVDRQMQFPPARLPARHWQVVSGLKVRF